jgi:hypothetical protein
MERVFIGFPLTLNYRTFRQSPPLNSDHDCKPTPTFHQAIGMPFMQGDRSSSQDHLWDARPRILRL